MRVKMERQSVSTKDDRSAPNSEFIEIMNNCKLKDFVKILIESYCPKVKKDRAVWVLWDRHKALAVFDSVNAYSKFFYSEDLPLNEVIKDAENADMYLYYREEEKLGHVFDELREELIG
ncbi:hypothetical protein NNC19_16920 [Clostridium sp. SHJSY1]|uniref:hypothetical protein n=1 Tax=Clostridium sp. SHJSY1 TaxID=2942483 RepID=UPI002875D7CE|nr:hypothetical protein [Clostridium sp. SHJSY1]MDS0527375.1 hypothetical protein [Clostridium sp. SHJSY1]